MDHVSATKTLTVQERENISGARVFDGEDQGKYQHNLIRSIHDHNWRNSNSIKNQFSSLSFLTGAGNRYKMQQLQQRDWCEQQISEKTQKKQLEKTVNDLFDQQTLEFNKILKQTQEDHNKART